MVEDSPLRCINFTSHECFAARVMLGKSSDIRDMRSTLFNPVLVTQREETRKCACCCQGKTFLLSYLFAGLYRELHVWLLSCVCGVCVLIWRPVDSNITTSFVTLKQRGSSFCSNNFAPWKNCSLKMKYIQGLIPLLKHTRNQPRNRKFQEQAVFKPEKQAIVPKINGKRQTISTATTVTSIANILRFICYRRCWFDGSWLPGAMVCFSLNPIAA